MGLDRPEAVNKIYLLTYLLWLISVRNCKYVYFYSTMLESNG